MMRRFSTLLLGSICLVALGAPAFATSDSIEEVVVTASKRPEALKNVPMSVTVVGQDQLDHLNARGVQDLVATVPGFALTDANPTHPDLVLRGIYSGGDGSTVGTYIDETPIGSSNSLANGAITGPNADTYDLAQVEVLRGPQGTLYGASAEGGLIKYVTNRPDPSGFDASVEVGATDVAHGGSGASARGMVNLPIGDSFAVRGVFFYQRTPGYIDNTFTGQRNIDHLKSEGGRVSALWQASDKFSVRVTMMQGVLKDGSTDAEDVTAVGSGFTPLFGNYIQKRAESEQSGIRYQVYNATVNWDLNWATLTSATSYDLVHDYVLQDGTALPSVGFSFVQGFVHQGKFTQELRLASDPGQGPLDWLIGGYYTNETSSLRQDIVTSFHGPYLIDIPGLGQTWLQVDSNYNEKAVFANATYHFSPQFDISAGGRYSQNGQHAFQTNGLPALLGPDQRGASSGDVFTWSTTASYHVDDDTTIYGRIAKGFRPGGPNTTPAGAPCVPGPGVSCPPLIFGADSLINYEIGAKGEIPSANLTFDADAFLINWDNIQLIASVANTGVTVNGGSARSQGFEGNITWNPVDRLTINLNGAYVDAHLTSDTPDLDLSDGHSGDPLAWVPKWSLALSGDYQFLPIGGFTPYVGATWRYVDRRFSDFEGQSTINAFALMGIPLAAQTVLPSYNTLDLRAGVNWDNWNLEIFAKNVTDAKIFTGFSATGISGAPGAPLVIDPATGGALGTTAGTAALGQPRLIGAVLRWKY
ncbi:MAG: TonB-dependent receptor [Rhizomicrobium sp.]